MPNGGPEKELPRYKCHKEVSALKINLVGVNEANGMGLITPEDRTYATFDVSKDYMDKHDPKTGGYYVIHEDGYKSFSPAEAFEEDYTRL